MYIAAMIEFLNIALLVSLDIERSRMFAEKSHGCYMKKSYKFEIMAESVCVRNFALEGFTKKERKKIKVGFYGH